MKTAQVQVHAATAQYGTWLSYSGNARVVLAIVLLAVAAGVAYAGTRLPLPARPARPSAAARKVRVVAWLFSLAALMVCVTVYLKHVLRLFHGAAPTDPITPVTVMGVCVTFLIIFVAGNSYGTRTALVSAAVGAMAAPMIFEFPFDLIVMARTYPPVPPDPAMYRVLFFAPLLLVEVTTLALLPLSGMVRLSRATLFCFALMLGVFAVWALSGFAFPSGPAPFALNVTSKILAFAAALSLFLPQRAPVAAPGQAHGPATPIMQAPPRARAGANEQQG